jgi:hypothetical protein
VDALDLACRALLAVVFAGAVAGKLRPPGTFESFVDSVVALVPAWAPVRPLAVAVVTGEAAVPPLLIMGAPGYALAAVLLLVFTLAIAGTVRRRTRVRCHCFGSDGAVLGIPHLIRNGLLLLVAVAGALASGIAAAPPIALVALTAGGLLGLAVARWEDLMFVFGRAPAGAESRRNS